ncbi:hypothetical protein HDU83_006298 [Entophlyctis luteolus]|nr:hypothetical protein HDU82_007801 [Entophlyctis luteolus]KAJ3353808.1 hypothetical protein HDU83_006298 [Entophlyctis luteolus]
MLSVPPGSEAILAVAASVMAIVSFVQLVVLVVYVLIFERRKSWAPMNTILCLMSFSQIGCYVSSWASYFYIESESGLAEQILMFATHFFVSAAEITIVWCSWTRGSAVVDVTIPEKANLLEAVFLGGFVVLSCQMIPDVVFLVFRGYLAEQTSILEMIKLGFTLLIGIFLVSFDVVLLAVYAKYLKRTKVLTNSGGRRPLKGTERLRLISHYGSVSAVIVFYTVCFYALASFQSDVYLYAVFMIAYYVSFNAVPAVWFALKVALLLEARSAVCQTPPATNKGSVDKNAGRV